MSAFADSDASPEVESIPTPSAPTSGPLSVELDGTDFSGCALEGSVTRRLNRPALATIKIPMDCAAGCSGPGQRLKISFDGGSTLFFHGMVMDWELDGDEDFGYITLNASDPMELWQWRVARDDTGDFTVPTFIQDYVTGPQIMEDILNNTVNTAGGPPADAEGPIFLDMGSFETDGCDLTGAPVDWPMTIAQVFSLLGSTGCVDLVITPTDPGGGVMGTVDGYNGDYGTDLSGSVVFEYGTGALNVRALRWNQDMSTIVNKNWYYLGPRVLSEADPAGDQHWKANITGQNQAFNTVDVNATGAWGGGNAYVNLDTATNVIGAVTVTFVCHLAHTSTAADEPGVGANWPLYWFVWKAPPGGRSVDATNTPVGPPWTDNPLGECIYNSRQTYGVRMQVSIYDAQGDEALSPVARELYQRLWQGESWARQTPRTLVHVTPIRGTEIGTFDIGDLVGVTIGSGICGGTSGAQRVYQYTISWTADGPFELSELQTSSDVGVETGV